MFQLGREVENLGPKLAGDSLRKHRAAKRRRVRYLGGEGLLALYYKEGARRVLVISLLLSLPARWLLPCVIKLAEDVP
jgi:hypothetical protein